MPLDIMSVLEDLYESKYYESVRQAANDLDNASGRPIDALPELEALIDGR
ncbi:MAG: hypothetical protein CM15mV35_710 [uncultured marine virus]|nr:MAG: hypothetical protein CM15mV35_710 [uncultured marine virus]